MGNYTSETILSPTFRLSFPVLFNPEIVKKTGYERYSLLALWSFKNFTTNDTKQWWALQNILESSSRTCFGVSYENMAHGLKKGLHSYDPTSKLRGLEMGDMYSNMSSTRRPKIVDNKRNRIGLDLGNDSLIYPGCWCRAIILVFNFDHSKNKGLAIGFQNIQKVSDGDRLDVYTEDPNEECDDFEDDIDKYWDTVNTKQNKQNQQYQNQQYQNQQYQNQQYQNQQYQNQQYQNQYDE
jgi:hypothetical protein